MTELTMGSLFDGSGGFPLGAKHAGIEPKWASEIEPFSDYGYKQEISRNEAFRRYSEYQRS